MKIEKIRAYGATVHVIDGFYAEAYAACEERAFDTGAAFMHPYDQPAVVAGQGTLAAELSGQAPALDTVIVAVGGGGLIAGVAAWYASDTRVIGVEPQRCPTLSRALASGEVVDVEVGGVAADALGAQRAGLIALGIAAAVRAAGRLVSDDDIMRARRLLWDACRIVVGARRGGDPRGAARWGLRAAARRADRARLVRRQHRPVRSGGARPGQRVIASRTKATRSSTDPVGTETRV